MTKAAPALFGLVGVAVGAALVLLAHPRSEEHGAGDPESVAVLREIHVQLRQIAEELRASPGAGHLPPARPADATPERMDDPLVADLQRAVSDLAAAAAQLRQTASSRMPAASDAPRVPTNAEAIREIRSRMPNAGNHMLTEVFGTSPAAAYARFGIPTSVSSTGVEVRWYYRDPDGGRGGMSLVFIDGYLTGIHNVP